MLSNASAESGPERNTFLLHHDNARPHCSAQTQDAMTGMKFTVVPHPPYSQDLAPSDFWLFPKLKETLVNIFIGCRSWCSCAQINQQPARNFLHGRNEQMDRTTEKMCSRKWWLCWKISVQCVREINFFHSDIALIIIHCHKLISYNWRPYLSIIPHMFGYLHIWRIRENLFL